jgi:hypothetical protein
MKKILTTVLFMAAFATVSVAQRNRPKPGPVGAVYGEIVINEVVGSGLTTFTCANLVVSANKLGGAWHRASRAIGDFKKRRCTFVVPLVPAGDAFVAVLNARMPSCDQKAFETTTSFPMTLKSGESLKYNFSVTKITCVLLK